MAKKRDSHFSEEGFDFLDRQNAIDSAQAMVGQVAKRFDKQYKGEGFELPPEVEAMPIFLEWTARKSSRFSLGLGGPRRLDFALRL